MTTSPTAHAAKRRSRHLVRIGLCLSLGVLTTIGVTVAGAWFINLHNTSGATRPSVTPGVQTGSGSAELNWPIEVSIGLDGSHTSPFHMDVRAVGARRLAYFEKRRAYDLERNPAGPLLPAGSSAAVGCWSFASGVRGLPITDTKPVTLPPEVLAVANDPAPRAAWGMAEDRRGWPFPAFKGWIVGSVNPANVGPWEFRSGLRIDDPLQGATNRRDSLFAVRMIPIQPMWPGLIGDSLVFAAGFFVIGYLVSVVRRRFVRKAGHCASCGYDLAGAVSERCPECGTVNQIQQKQPPRV